MLELIDPDIIFTGGIACFWKQAEVLLQASFKAGFFHGKTYFNTLHADWLAGKTVTIRFNDCPQQDKLMRTYLLISQQYQGRRDYRDSICAYLLSLIILEPES